MKILLRQPFTAWKCNGNSWLPILLLLFILISFFAALTNGHVALLQETSNSTTSYATTSDVKTLSYQVSVLQVVVVINSVLIGFILLFAHVLVATNCREDYKTLASEVLEGYEDPLWLKFFHLVNTLTYLMLCQCCCPTHMKRKMQVFRIFNEEEWRRWHHNDLKMQRGLISEDDNHDGQLVMPNPTTVNSQSSL